MKRITIEIDMKDEFFEGECLECIKRDLEEDIVDGESMLAVKVEIKDVEVESWLS